MCDHRPPFLRGLLRILVGPPQLHGLEIISDTEIDAAISGSVHVFMIFYYVLLYKQILTKIVKLFKIK
jgi:hypothetical protein